MAEKEYVLGNKAKDLYQYTRQVTKPGADDKVDTRDVAAVMRTATAERLEHKRSRPYFPKSESFGMIKDLRDAARAILRGVFAANETRFNDHPEDRLREIKAVIDECGLMLQLVELAHDLGYTDTKRMGTWTKRILDVKYMCLAWLKKDTERAKAIHTSRQRADCDTMVKLVREILAAEAANK